jgi:hypothetical protein
MKQLWWQRSIRGWSVGIWIGFIIGRVVIPLIIGGTLGTLIALSITAATAYAAR